MFGIGKEKLPLDEVADRMAQVALMPLENPSEQDLIFQAQAIRAGMEKNRFVFEAIALQTYAMSAAINRERLEGKISPEKAEQLVVAFLRAFNNRLQNTTSCDLLLIGLGPDAAFELTTQRIARYSEPAWGRESIDDVPRFFADFCEIHDSDVLQRIGSSLMQFRGDYYGDWLRRIKII